MAQHKVHVVQVPDHPISADYVQLCSSEADAQAFVAATPGSSYRTITLDQTVQYDRQLATSGTSVSTTSASYLDLDGMSLATKDFGENGSYRIDFTCSASNTDANKISFFQVAVDGVLQPASETQHKMKAAEIFTPNISYVLPVVSGGTNIKVQYKTSGGALDVTQRCLMLDGVPVSQVI